MNPFKKLQDQQDRLEIILDALISVLVRKKVIRREDLQKHIIINAVKTPVDDGKSSQE